MTSPLTVDSVLHRELSALGWDVVAEFLSWTEHD